jgi:hypothetical protein
MNNPSWNEFLGIPHVGVSTNPDVIDAAANELVQFAEDLKRAERLGEVRGEPRGGGWSARLFDIYGMLFGDV